MSNNLSNELSLKEKQKAAVDTLIALDDICKRLKINYWILYGTLIGGVRHQGFIPWDDDIDVGMKREDYDCFIKFFIDNKKSILPYYIDNYLVNKKYPFYIARFCNPKYYAVFNDYDYHSGAFVDIYPIDGMGNNIDPWNEAFRQGYKYKKGLLLSVCKFLKPFGSSPINIICNYPLKLLCRIIGRDYFIKKIDIMSKKYRWDDSYYVGVPIWSSKVYNIQKSWFDETVYLKFQNLSVPVPKEYDKCLHSIYGDYMKLPPKSQRKPSHEYKEYLVIK